MLIGFAGYLVLGVAFVTGQSFNSSKHGVLLLWAVSSRVLWLAGMETMLSKRAA